MADREYFIACPAGLEEVVAGEARALGAEEVRARVRGVSCAAPASFRYRANLWLRAAIRVLEPILRAEVDSPESLYDAVRSVDWSRYLTVKQRLSVDARVRDSALTHSGYAALRVKDAIVDQFRDRFGARPNAGPTGADLPLSLHLHRNRMTLSRDTSGETLHKRGYHEVQVRSPLNEALAAGILEITGWDRASPLADPMCGSGTFPIEAAMMAAGMAPGLARPGWPFEAWPDFDAAEWSRARAEAKGKARRSLPFPIFASDHHAGALDLARKSARTAGVEGMIRFSVGDVADFNPDPRPGLLVMNPPYGKRLDAGEDLEGLYRKIGSMLRRFRGAKAWVLSGARELTRFIGLRASRHVDLMNGDIECRLLRYEVFEGPPGP